MIIVGFPAIGKSSVSGGNNIDLESSNFWITDANGNKYRNDEWIECYCNIARDLSSQGFNVFLSSHGGVIKHLNDTNTEFFAIFPDIQLKELWINRLKERYCSIATDKNKKALDRVENYYEEDIKALKETCANYYALQSTHYTLEEVIHYIGLSEEYKKKHNICCLCSVRSSGYCLLPDGAGC